MAKKVSIEIELLDRISGSVDRINRRLAEMGRQGKAAQSSLNEIDGAAEKLKKTLAGLGVALSMKELVGKVASVRGEFQQLEVAFDTMLGSAEKADALMEQLVHTAAITPFDLEGVANGAKQLLAYGLEADKVNDTLIRLGDIAAGLSIPLGDIVYLYGTTMAQGRLYTQDLNQFTGRGIPMIQELAKQFGVAEGKVKELVEQGKVGFPEVQKVIESLTGEGSKFGGLMEAQSKTISGQIANIEDAIDTMFNEMGQKSEGIINATLGGVSTVVENYERFGRILLSVTATWGAYRAAVMLAAAASGFATTAEALHYNWLLLVEKAQKALNATMLANPYVLVATAIAGTVAALVSMRTATERVNDIMADYDQKKQEAIAAEEEHRRKMDELCDVAGDEALSTDTRREALAVLIQKYPAVFAKYKTEYDMLKNIRDIKREIAELDGKKSVTSTQNEQRSLANAVREIERELEARKTGSSVQRNRKFQGTSTQTLMDTLRGYKGRLATVNKQAETDRANAYFANLTGISNKDLQKQISERQNLLAKMQTSGKRYGLAKTGAGGTYNRDQLQGQLQLLQAEQKRRKEKRGSSREWSGKAKTDYEKALKEYNAFLINTGNNLTQTEYETRLKELKERLDTAKKDYDKSKAQTSADDKKAAKEATAAEKREEQQRQAKEKLGLQLADLQRENDQQEIDAMQEGLQKKLRQIDNDYNQRKNKIEKQEADFRTANKKAGIATGSDGLTGEQRDALATATEQNEKTRQKAIADANREELKAMRDYLREYGTLQQQKLAITEEYAEKIAKAQNEWERKSLEKERDKALASLSFENISMGIDWKALFSGVDTMAKEMMQPMMDKLEAYTKTDEYLGADSQTQQKVVELVQELRQYLGSDSSTTWQTLAKSIEDFNKAVAVYQGQEAADPNSEATLQAKENMERLGKRLNDVSEAVAGYTSKLSAALSNAKAWEGADGMGNVQNAVQDIDTLKGALDSVLPEMGDGMAKTIGSGLSQVMGSGLSSMGSSLGGILSSALGSLVGVIAQIPKLILSLVDAVKNFVTGILDSISELLSFEWLSDLVNSILEAVGNLIDTIFDLPENIYKALSSIVVNGIGGLLDTVVGRIGNIVSLGALSSAGPSQWFNNSNAKEVQEAIDKLTDRNEILTTAIDNLTDELAKTSGMKAVENAKQAEELQKEKEANLLQIAKEQASYHGAHGSFNRYWGGFTDEEIADFSRQIGREWSGSLWDLSTDEMARLQSNADMWQKITDTGKGGYGERVAEKLADYAAEAGELQDIVDTLNESLTQTTFDTMRSDFISNLMDMDKSAEDFADDFTEMLMQSVLNARIADLMDSELQDFYDEWAERAKDGLDSEDISYLQGKWAEITEAGLALRDEAAKVTGYTGDSGTSQSGKSGGFTTMTQDQGTKLEGMFTSGLQHWSSMDARLETVSDRMTTAETHLARIEENTALSASHLAELKEQVRQIIRDGLRMK